VTDPPYFDEIAYADLSDFFYIWLKRFLGEASPAVFATPLTPKADEATALRHRSGGDSRRANECFRLKLTGAMCEIRRATKGQAVVAVMFAHQSAEAWTALINALLDAGLSITAAYPIDTERSVRMVALGTSALASSITVICRPRVAGSAASYKMVRSEIEEAVHKAVKRFWAYGFRGADLIVACYGPAVGVFGRHERVEKADGTAVGIPELLELVRFAARDAIAGEFRGDHLSTVYYVWANLYGIGEQSWDDARLVVQVGGEGEDPMEVARKRGLLVVEGSRCRLALLRDRLDRSHMGDDESAPLIDKLHHAMRLWQEEKRPELVAYLREHGLTDDARFWKLAQALFEVLPPGEEDRKLARVLLDERDTLRVEAGRKEAAPLGPLFNGQGAK